MRFLKGNFAIALEIHFIAYDHDLRRIGPNQREILNPALYFNLCIRMFRKESRELTPKTTRTPSVLR
jgi:hypothetical protein